MVTTMFLLSMKSQTIIKYRLEDKLINCIVDWLQIKSLNIESLSRQ